MADSVIRHDFKSNVYPSIIKVRNPKVIDIKEGVELIKKKRDAEIIKAILENSTMY